MCSIYHNKIFIHEFSQARTNNANQVLDRDYSQYLPSIKESRGEDAEKVDDGPEIATDNVRDFM